MNAKRGFYNVFFGMLGQIISIALGIIIPRLVLVSLGSESNGLLSSVNQALVYLNLLEAGIGTATLQALYKPVAEFDTQSINHIMAATNRYYKKVGTWYFLATVALAIVFPIVVNSELSYFTIFSVVLLSGMSQVVNFFFQGKYRILMQVEGKSYILTNLGTIINVFTSISKIALLLQGFDIVALQLMYFAFNIVQMLYILYYIKKKYTWLDLSVTPNYDAISQRNSVMVHQISGLIFQNTDVLILTLVCGLKTVSVYSMYVMLFGMIGTAISTINSGVSFAMGQAYNTDKKRFNILYNAFETYNMALTFSLYCVANIFIIPFLKLYTAGVTDINYIDSLLPYLFVATYLLSNGRSAAQRVIEYAGHFKLTQNRSIIESVINIVVSLICVVRFGIYGVLCGTIAALLYRTNDMIIYASKKLLNRSPMRTYIKWGINLILYILFIMIFTKMFAGVEFTNYFIIIISAVVVCIIVVFAFFFVGSVIDKESFLFCIEFVKTHMQRKKEKMHENLSRSRDLDVAKGLGILLVVVGHGYSHSTNIEVLIYGFHMPFFFIVSGMIYGQKQEQFRFDFCKKIKTLIIPYLFFEFMWWLCIALMNVKNTDWDGTEIAIKAVFFRGNIATWYLPCLFLTELIFWMVLHTGKFKYFVIAVLYVLGVALPGQLNESWLTILRPLVGVGFFALGYYGYKVFQIKCNGFINLGLTILYILITIHNGLILFYVREFHNIFLFVISSVIGTYLVLRFSANITEMANRYNCCNILFSRLCYWGENSLAIMCIHMFVIEILRALDYRLFNSFLPVLGESEGIFLGCVIMLCCEMIIPVLNKYFSFCIGKKKSFYGGGHQD